MQQSCYGRTLGSGLFIQETPGTVLAHHKLLKQGLSGVAGQPQAYFPHLALISDPHLQRFVKPAVTAVGKGPAPV